MDTRWIGRRVRNTVGVDLLTDRKVLTNLNEDHPLSQMMPFPTCSHCLRNSRHCFAFGKNVQSDKTRDVYTDAE